MPEDATNRLDLFRPVLGVGRAPGDARTGDDAAPSDAVELHGLLSDPRVWAHFPRLRHSALAQTVSLVRWWAADWDRLGIGTWIVRRHGEQAIIGYGGLSPLGGGVWNLGYRFAPEVHGHGFATELGHRALERAGQRREGYPVVAYMLKHNAASVAVARKLGLELVDRGPDAGNPDPDAIRLIFAQRRLTDDQLAAARR